MKRHRGTLFVNFNLKQKKATKLIVMCVHVWHLPMNCVATRTSSILYIYERGGHSFRVIVSQITSTRTVWKPVLPRGQPAGHSTIETNLRAYLSLLDPNSGILKARITRDESGAKEGKNPSPPPPSFAQKALRSLDRGKTVARWCSREAHWSADKSARALFRWFVRATPLTSSALLSAMMTFWGEVVPYVPVVAKKRWTPGLRLGDPIFRLRDL